MNKKDCLFTIEIDALGPEAINRKDTPFLYSLAKKNFTSRIQTTLTFTQFVEIFAGLKPEESNYFTLFLRDKKNSDYKWIKYFMPFFKLLNIIHFSLVTDKIINMITILKKYLSGKTYFALKSKIPLNILSEFNLCSDEAICEKGLFYNKKTIYDVLRDLKHNFVYIALPFIRVGKKKKFTFFYMSDEKVVDIAINLSKNHYNFYHLYFRGVDAITHYNGLNSLPVKKRLRKIDCLIKKLYNHFKKINKNVKFMIFSDHGMVDIKKHINIIKILKKSDLKESKDYLAFYDSTFARFWLKKEKIPVLINALKNIKEGHVLSEKEKKKFGIAFKNNPYGDVIFLVDPGVLILPNYFQGTKPVKAMHTYDPIKNLDGMLIHEGKSKKGLFKKRLHLTKLYDIIIKEIKRK